MIIKVCGMREPENIHAVETLGVDWVGAVFYSCSPRCVSKLKVYPLSKAKRVGVFVNETVEQIKFIAHQYKLDYIQLHGDESPEMCRMLKAENKGVIKAFSIHTEKELAATAAYEGWCDYFLFDTPCSGHGGSGVSFNWSVLNAYSGKTSFLLSGGIGPESLDALHRFRHERWVGVDLNSRFETAPGLKDVEKLKLFITQLKETIN